MDDALARILDAEMADAVRGGVGAHLAHQLDALGIAVLGAVRRGRDDMVLRRQGELGMGDLAPVALEPGEGPGACRLLQDVAVDEDEVAPALEALHDMGVPDLLEESGAQAHARPHGTSDGAWRRACMNVVSLGRLLVIVFYMPSAQSRAEAPCPDKANFLAVNDLGSCEDRDWKILAANNRIMLEL